MAQTGIISLGGIAAGLARLRGNLYQSPANTISGVQQGSWPSPLQPVAPIAPAGAQPLAWPFYEGRNLTYTPRDDAEYDAQDLRNFAAYPLARICIDNVKDQLGRLRWSIQAKLLPGELRAEHKKRQKGDGNIGKLTRFFERPNAEQSWAEFIRPICDDMLTADNPAIRVLRAGKDGKGKVMELRPTVGDFITRYIDDTGDTPQPPLPAYAQLWYGIPRINLTTEQLVYKPRNIVFRGTQSSALYGLSPTESIATEIQIGINRLQWVLNFYTTGSIPDALMITPAGADPKLIRTTMDWMNSELSGDLAKRRGFRMIQGFTSDGKDQVLFPKAAALADAFDDLHIRKICFAYGTSPQRLLKMMNRASSDSNQEAAEEEGLEPWIKWLKDLVDYIIAFHLQMPDYEMAIAKNTENDILKQSEADKTRSGSALNTINEIRELRGDDPSPEPEANQLGILTATGWVPLAGSAERVQNQQQQQAKPKPGDPEVKPKPAPQKLLKSGHAPRIDAELHPHSVTAKRKIGQVLTEAFSRQKEAALAVVGGMDIGKVSKAAQTDAILYAIWDVIDEEWKDVVPDVEPALIESIIAGTGKGFLDLQVTTNAVISQANELAAEWAKERAAELVGMKYVDGALVVNPNAKWAISDTTRDMIREDVVDALSKETPMKALQEAIQESGAFSADRASMIARTEVTRAQSNGTFRAWQASGVVKSVRWSTSADHDEPDECDENESAGAVDFGEPFPSGDLCPPQHPRCRCALIAATIQ